MRLATQQPADAISSRICYEAGLDVCEEADAEEDAWRSPFVGDASGQDPRAPTGHLQSRGESSRGEF